MKIQSLTAFEVPVRLRGRVRHASHERTSNQSLFIRCELSDGSVGWGEGLPRTYVTGESMGSVWRHLAESDFALLAEPQFSEPADAAERVAKFPLADVHADDGVKTRECFGNVVRCALELSLLDAGCRATGQSVGDVLHKTANTLGVARSHDEVRYSGVVTAGNSIKQWRSAIRMRLFGFHQLKAKVGMAGNTDEQLLTRLRRIVKSDVDIRLDANEAWNPDDVVSRLKPLLPFRPTSLEQPVPHAHVGDLAGIRRDVSIPVMLDESLCSEADAERAIRDDTCDLFNLRISKCGGLLNCVRLAAMAKEAGLGYQLGCQVGETGILSAAGRHFACNIDGCRYLEGSYDRFLVKDSFTVENMTFGYRGRAGRISGPGLGVTVDEAKIRRNSVRTECLFSR